MCFQCKPLVQSSLSLSRKCFSLKGGGEVGFPALKWEGGSAVGEDSFPSVCEIGRNANKQILVFSLEFMFVLGNMVSELFRKS